MSVADYLDQHPEWMQGDQHTLIRMKLPSGETPLLRNNVFGDATDEFLRALSKAKFIRLERL